LINQEKDDEELDACVLRAKILNAHFLLVTYSVKYGISLNRWQNVVNLMIEKSQATQGFTNCKSFIFTKPTTV
jgi:hypothetical protein